MPQRIGKRLKKIYKKPWRSNDRSGLKECTIASLHQSSAGITAFRLLSGFLITLFSAFMIIIGVALDSTRLTLAGVALAKSGFPFL